MRIIGGRLGGRRIASPRGHTTRPTSERVREGLASALDARGLFEEAAVLDLFAGTGALSFEALSRGASSAVLVEKDPTNAQALTKSAHELGLDEQVSVLALDLERPARTWMRRLPERAFDLVFIDPPYARIALVNVLLAALSRSDKLSPNAAIAIEHARRDPPSLPDGFSEIATYRYGDTAVLLCTLKEPS